MLAPGVPLTHPEPHWTVRQAKLAGVEVIGDIELFARERRAQSVRARRVIAITGTNGKSTTTALTAHILTLRASMCKLAAISARRCFDLADFAPRRHLCASSVVLPDRSGAKPRPDVGVLLNITPDHLDRHGTIENYAAIKARLARAACNAVVGVDDDYCRAIADALRERRGGAGPVEIVRLSTRASADCEIGVDGRRVVLKCGHPTEIADLSGIGSLRGAHNAENACAAAAALLLLPEPLTREQIAAGMKSFPGLAHRMEELGRQGRTLFVNDSKATNADSAEKALLSFPGDIYWIWAASRRPVASRA